MEPALLPTLAALAGTVVGSLTSLATTWMTQSNQARAARTAAEWTRRNELYGKFLDETARLYSLAVSKDKIDYADLVEVFALRGRITLQSDGPVTQRADAVITALIGIYMAPKRSDAEVLQDLETSSSDLMGAFAAACRKELGALQ